MMIDHTQQELVINKSCHQANEMISTTTTTTDFLDIYMIRHGQTNWNLERKLQGHNDIPLNELGEKQAHELSETFRMIENPFSSVYCSDMLRARRTVEIVLSNSPHETVPIVETELLREKYMSQWEGKSFEEIREIEEDYEHIWYSKDEFLSFKCDPKAECHRDVYARLMNFVKDEVFYKNVGETVLFSTHAGVIGTILYHLEFKPGYDWHVPNCTWIKIRVSKEGTVQLLNKHSKVRQEVRSFE